MGFGSCFKEPFRRHQAILGVVSYFSLSDPYRVGPPGYKRRPEGPQAGLRFVLIGVESMSGNVSHWRAGPTQQYRTGFPEDAFLCQGWSEGTDNTYVKSVGTIRCTCDCSRTNPFLSPLKPPRHVKAQYPQHRGQVILAWKGTVRFRRTPSLCAKNGKIPQKQRRKTSSHVK